MFIHFRSLFPLLLLILFCAGCAVNEGVTPLMRAADSGDLTTVKSLITEKKRVDQPSSYKWTALIFAARNGHDSVVEELIAAGADPNIVSEEVPIKWMASNGGQSPTTALREALGGKNVSTARLLMKHGARLDPEAIALAGKPGDVPFLQMLKTKYQVDFNQPGPGLYPTALSAAIQNDQLKAVKWLTNHGADVNLIPRRTSPLAEAVRKDNKEMVRYLLQKGANPNAVFGGDLKSTALFEAAIHHIHDRSANLAIIKMLLAHGADKSHVAYGNKTAAEFLKHRRSFDHKYKGSSEKSQQRIDAARSHRETVIKLLE